MTRPSDEARIVKRVILFFDICSSTSILEDLIRTENQTSWRDLLIDIKNYLRSKRSSVDFEIYKFLGDGWILLFEPSPDGAKIFDFLDDLSDKFVARYNRRIKTVLTTRIPNVGLTFGMDVGSCIRAIMNQTPEYTGRPLNVAARLQSAIGQRDRKPQYKVLLSNNLYATFDDRREIEDAYKVNRVRRTLKNISGGEEYLCRKVWLTRAQ